MDIAISFPGQGQIRLESRHLFAEPANETCREFLHRVFQAPEITDVTIHSHQPAGTPHADLRFCPNSHSLPEVVQRISTFLDPGRSPGAGPTEPARTAQAGNGHAAEAARPTARTRPATAGASTAQ